MTTSPYPFVASTVLTADQLNSTFNIPVTTVTASHILIAGNAGTRLVMNSASATTITVDTSIFSAGDNLEISNIGAGVTTVTAGSATVSSAGPLAIPQYGGGTLYFTSAGVSIYFPSAVTIPPASSGLTLVSDTTIDATVSSVTVSSAFSSTYDNYLVNVSGGVGSQSSVLRLTLGATSTNYYYFNVYGDFTAGTVSGTNGNNASYFEDAVGTSTNSLSGVFNLIAPNLAKRTSYNNNFIQTATGGFVLTGTGFLNDDTQYTDFTLTVANGTITGGNIRVYGYANS